MAPPRVSVLLPVRDGATHLPAAIASLAAQTFQDFEVVAVDDGSTDDTAMILRDWAGRNPRVRVLHQEARGIVDALERARREAAAPLLARMDADDVAMPTRLLRQVRLLDARPELSVVGCGVRYYPDHAVQDGARRYEAWINGLVTHDQIVRDLFVECPIAHPTLVVRADLMEEVGGYEERGWPEDYDLVFRLWAAGATFGKVPEVLLRWREGPDRLSRTDPRYDPQAFRRCKAHYLRELVLKGRDVVVWGAGPVGKGFSRALHEAGVAVRAFVEVDPRKIGQEIHGVPVLDTPAGLAVRDAFHCLAVGQPGGRETLRAVASGGGLQELRDFVAVA